MGHQPAIKLAVLQNHDITASLYVILNGVSVLCAFAFPVSSLCFPPPKTRVGFTLGLTVPKTNAVSHFPCVK